MSVLSSSHTGHLDLLHVTMIVLMCTIVGVVVVSGLLSLIVCYCFFFFFKQKTAYEIVSRDWSSDVCSSDLKLFPNSKHCWHSYIGTVAVKQICIRKKDSLFLTVRMRRNWVQIQRLISSYLYVLQLEYHRILFDCLQYSSVYCLPHPSPRLPSEVLSQPR